MNKIYGSAELRGVFKCHLATAPPQVAGIEMDAADLIPPWRSGGAGRSRRVETLCSGGGWKTSEGDAAAMRTLRGNPQAGGGGTSGVVRSAAVGGDLQGFSLRVFKPAMKSFYQPIRLRMIGGGGYVLNVEESAKGGPYCRGKLGTPVTVDCCWQPEPLHPSREECDGAVGGCGGRDGYGSAHLVVLSIIVNVLPIFMPLTYYLCFTKPEQIKKLRGIDLHGPKPSLNICQPPGPPSPFHYPLPLT